MTSRRSAEAVPPHRWAECQALIDAFPFYILVIDDEHRIALANKAVLRDPSVAPEDIVGQYCPKVVHGCDEPFPGCPLEEAVERGNIAVERELFDTAHGRWFNSAVYPIGRKTDKGRALFLHIVQDIHDRKEASERITKALDGVVHALGATIESRDAYTAGHQQRVDRLAMAIANKMALPVHNMEGLHVAALIHDIGKLAVPAEILSRPSQLSSIEYQLIHVHPETAYGILEPIGFPWPVADIVLQHHERLDGSGYPRGLQGEDILLEARILAVCDVIEAMASHRPYRPALGVEAALDEIATHKGTLYDAAVVDACLSLFAEEGFTFDD